MPTAVHDLPGSAEPRRKRWTRAEYEDLSSSGSVDLQRLELIEGELIDKVGKKRPHVNSLVLLQRWLVKVFGDLRVNPEAPIDVAPEDNPTNEPEPDLIVLNRDLNHFTSRNPGPADLELVIEIGDTSLAFDLSTKARLYARAGIIEYWVLDIPGRRMIVHRNPQEGLYASVEAYSAEESLAPLASPESCLRVSDAFAA
jgi:Uma2 family endonuclease